MSANARRANKQKLDLFGRRFTGLTHVYGTYDVKTGRSRQVKSSVTPKVMLDHLVGRQPYGVYFLVKDRTRALAVDFDDGDLTTVMGFVDAARNYDLDLYIERSKSKGHHVWMFFPEDGVVAAKARTVARLILEDIEGSNTEVFPKQDRLDTDAQYGNFINAPLFGRLVPEGRTVFLDPYNGMKPYTNQWDFLESVTPTPEHALDEIINVNGLNVETGARGEAPQKESRSARTTLGLPPCARKMLEQGVTHDQRVACFDLAIQLKKAGLPHDLALATLRAWANKNKPHDGKRIITETEIKDQTADAFNKPYSRCGCEDPAVKPFCSAMCPLGSRNSTDDTPDTKEAQSGVQRRDHGDGRKLRRDQRV